MSIPTNIEIVVPWRAIKESESERSALLSARLVHEVPAKHVLHGLKPNAVATRIDEDDVLFEVSGGEMPLAVVHMTWRKDKEADSCWPRTKLFRNWEHWVSEDMQPAHQEYVGC
jgi:hypothetical protein